MIQKQHTFIERLSMPGSVIAFCRYFHNELSQQCETGDIICYFFLKWQYWRGDAICFKIQLVSERLRVQIHNFLILRLIEWVLDRTFFLE